MTRILPFVMLIAALPQTAGAQSTLSRVLSSEIAISRERAEIQLELEDGRRLTLGTNIGSAAGGFQRTGDDRHQVLTLNVARGDLTDRSWRDLLNAAMDAEPELLGTLLRDWESPTEVGKPFDTALDAALLGGPVPGEAHPGVPSVVHDDSVVKLETKIQELEERLEAEAHEAARNEWHGPRILRPLRHVWRGISGIFALLVTYTILFGIGFIAILFGARKYLEGVSDTVRAGVGRSFVVGLAGSFLLLPVFVLGTIALIISIVGIPALIVWIPLFPVGALVACLLGFLGVAHAAGESFAERKYYGSDWFRRSNSYYFLVSGLALLGALFFAANVVTMAGPWLGFINNILNFFGIVLTWLAATIGFGAVLISRGGSRTAASPAGQTSLFTDDANV